MTSEHMLAVFAVLLCAINVAQAVRTPKKMARVGWGINCMGCMLLLSYSVAIMPGDIDPTELRYQPLMAFAMIVGGSAIALIFRYRKPS